MTRRHELVLLLLSIVTFLALALPGAGSRGVTSEEVQPYLRRHPVVLEMRGDGVTPMPPHESNTPRRPRWVRTQQWPVLAYDGEQRMWPVFIRGHQSALGSYVGIVFGPMLGGGVGGVQRTSVLLTAGLIPLAWWIAKRSFAARSDRRAPLLAAALVAISFGTLFFGRTGYAFEIASRVLMFAALGLAADPSPPSRLRGLCIGLVAGLAILSRATIATTMLPALAVLLLGPRRRPSRRGLFEIGVLAVGLPVAAVVLTHLAIGLDARAAPLADYPLRELPGRLLSLPVHLIVQLAWLGDAQSILGPIRTGARSIAHLAGAAAVGAAAVTIVAVRVRRRTAGDGERMLIAGLLGNVVGGAVLYGDPWQFQLAMALDPLLAIAVAEQVGSIAPTRALALAAAALLVRTQTLVLGLRLDSRGSNPIFSGRAQLALIEQLQQLSIRGPELVTTNYNHAGVIEAWTHGAIAPVHAWSVLKSDRPDAERRMFVTFRSILQRYRPRYVLFSTGVNPYDGPFTANDLARRGLEQALDAEGGRIVTTWSFPTESGAPGFGLVMLELPGSVN